MTARRLALAAVLGLLVLVPAGAAAPGPQEVSVEFSDYRPSQLDVLPGETVLWTNVSVRTHTVTSDTGLFDSGRVESNDRFSFQFNEVGTYRYHCTIHPSITGEVDVRRVTLGFFPTAVVKVGTPLDIDGRTADPKQQVVVQRKPDGGSFTTVATVTPAADGTWKTTVKAEVTGDYRATSGTDVSETRRLLVSSQHVIVRPTRTGVAVTVTPSAPYAKFLVETFSRERFGWYPVANGLIDYVSQADVRIARPARVRIVLVDKDGWTPIATSNVVVLR
ncbi:MAG: plastocyanin/azurin family copper-binding protein [Verrucomicrobiota bacterium]